MMPGTIAEGVYSLSSRLDALNATAARATIASVARAFVGVGEPIALAWLSTVSNASPVLLPQYPNPLRDELQKQAESVLQAHRDDRGPES